MSRTSQTAREHAQEVSNFAREVAGMIRRMVVGVTSTTFWQVLGDELLDGKIWTKDAEVFQGVGVVARPPEGASVETVVVFPAGGAAQPIVVGARDVATARAAVGELEPDETAIYTSAAIVVIKAGGTVEIRTPGGTAVPLATKDDLDKLMTAISTAITAMGGAGPAPELAALRTALQALIPLWPVGTTVLKAE